MSEKGYEQHTVIHLGRQYSAQKKHEHFYIKSKTNGAALWEVGNYVIQFVAMVIILAAEKWFMLGHTCDGVE